MSLVECTLRNETLDCVYPKVCYEVFDSASQALQSSHCGCLSNFGYQGADCYERSPSTKGIMSFYLITTILSTLFWIWALVKLAPKIYRQWITKTETTMTSSAALCLLGLGVVCLYIPFLCYQAAGGQVDERDGDHLRVQPLYDVVFHIMFVRIFLYEVNFVYISLAWYQVAYRTNNLKPIRRKRNRTTDYISALLSVVLLVVMVTMFASDLQGELYMFWGVTTSMCLLVWMAGALYITKTLETMNASNTFSTTLRKIRLTAAVAGVFLLTSAVGMFVQTTRGIPGHEPLPLSSFPPWIIGHILSVASVPLTYVCLLMFHVSLGDKTASSSNDGGGHNSSKYVANNGAVSPTMSTKSLGSKLRSPMSSSGNNNHVTVVNTVMVSSVAE
ncbi:hypothetical protein BASA81_004148 [Batrachochytrium salamandrivorans]|nr:hypothetical protein BASA81_004148 [Batrachochytrium salamandrivorans]